MKNGINNSQIPPVLTTSEMEISNNTINTSPARKYSLITHSSRLTEKIMGKKRLFSPVRKNPELFNKFECFWTENMENKSKFSEIKSTK